MIKKKSILIVFFFEYNIRVGDECPFGKRCSFIHPKDLVEPVKKRSSSTGTPKRNSTGPPKRAASSGGNTRNNNRDNTVTLKQ